MGTRLGNQRCALNRVREEPGPAGAWRIHVIVECLFPGVSDEALCADSSAVLDEVRPREFCIRKRRLSTTLSRIPPGMRNKSAWRLSPSLAVLVLLVDKLSHLLSDLNWLEIGLHGLWFK